MPDLSFVPASDGSLTEWPTFRTFLLDLLSAIDPTVLQLLANDTALRKARPEMSARQIARADIRVPAQRAIMKTWLLERLAHPGRTERLRRRLSQ